MDNVHNLKILNYSSGVFSNKASFSVGQAVMYGQRMHYTPAIAALSGDNKIVMVNSTHALTINADGTLNQSAALTFTNTTGTFTASDKYFIIKCTNTGLSGSFVGCFFEYINKVGASEYNHAIAMYDLTHNSIAAIEIQPGVRSATNDVNNYAGNEITIIDHDLSGSQDLLYYIDNNANGNSYVYTVDVSSNTTMTALLVYTLDLANAYYRSIPAVGNFDGLSSNGLEFMIFYRESATVYDAVMIDNNGTVLKNGFIAGGGVSVTNAEPAKNLVTSSTTPVLACSFVHYTTGADTYTCFDGNSLTYENFTETNTYTSAGAGSVHYMYDDNILVSGAVLDTSLDEVITAPNYNFIFPVDIQNNGALDAVCVNTSDFMIIDSLFVNSAPAITFGWGTGNPSCQGVVQNYSLTATDVDGDSSVCWIKYRYAANDSLIYTSPNSTVASGGTATFIYNLNETGTFKAVGSCTNYGHETNYTYIQVVSNNTDICYGQFEAGGSTTPLTPAQANATSTFENNIDTILTGVGVTSSKAKSIVALIICLLIAVGVFLKTQSTLFAVATLPISLLICYFLGMIGVFSIVVVLIVSIALLVYKLVGGNSGSAGM